MPYKDVTYDNGFTERFYYDETPEEEALRMSRINSVATFPSANHRSATHQDQPNQTLQPLSSHPPPKTAKMSISRPHPPGYPHLHKKVPYFASTYYCGRTVRYY